MAKSNTVTMWSAMEPGGDSIFAVWSYVDVVELPPDWNAFDKSASRGVDHVEPTFPPRISYQHAPTVLCHRDIVGTPAEPPPRQMIWPLARSTISSACFRSHCCGCSQAAIRGESNAVRRCNTADNLHNLVRRGVHHLDAIATSCR